MSQVDAVVSRGPNGLATAIVIAQTGFTKLLVQIAVPWLHASYTFSTRIRVQSSIAVN
jgi:hypothetical protein